MSNESESEETAQDAADETEAETESDTQEEAEGLQHGDFIELDYTARTVEGGDLVDTTDIDVAEEEDVDTDQQEFAPRTIVLGQGHIFDSVEEDITGKEVGDAGSVPGTITYAPSASWLGSRVTPPCSSSVNTL